MRTPRPLTTLLITLTAVVVISTPAIAFAGKPRLASTSRSPSAAAVTGNDISWPQCSKLKSLPQGQAFGIVGVTGGRANTTNPCFAGELAWAQKATGKTAQPNVAFYVNTGNPGDVAPAVADWPSSNVDIVDARFTDTDPYGSCTGANDAACAWQYGYNMAHSDISYRGVANPLNYRWYLDVETSNTWSANTANNAADLEGMVTYFESVGATVGLYSTSYQWGIIAGDNYGKTSDAGGDNLNGLPSWLPGASNQSGAKQYCAKSSLTPAGHVGLTQYISGQFDYDVSCS